MQPHLEQVDDLLFDRGRPRNYSYDMGMRENIDITNMDLLGNALQTATVGEHADADR